jgi:hypothetical protein
MRKMSASLRLVLCGALILVSAIYAVLVARDPTTASAIAVGYVALVVTTILIVNLWKRV